MKVQSGDTTGHEIIYMRIKHLLLMAIALMQAMYVNAAVDDEFFDEEGFKYTILSEDDHTVSIASGNYSSENNDYIIIPSEVTHGGVNYTVTEIAQSGFSYTQAYEIEIPNTVKIIREGAFEFSRAWFIYISESVTTIEDRAFHGSSLRYIKIPNSVTSIGKGAFYANPLQEVKLPSSLDKISDSLFEFCENLQIVTIPESVTEIGNRAFAICRSLESISIPESVTKIGNYAFQECLSLQSLTIPESVVSIGVFAFEACQSLTSITIPKSVENIGDGIFAYCINLEEILVDEGNQNFYSSNGLLISCNGYGYGNKLTLLQAPGALTECFIPDNIELIGCHAFSGCNKLISLTIPESVYSIGETSSFSKTMYSGLSNSVFYGCTSLTTININRASPPNIVYSYSPTSIFNGVPKDAIVYVPEGSLNNYLKNYNWNYFTDFREKNFNSVECIDVDNIDVNKEYYRLDGTLIDINTASPGIYISKSGSMTEKILIK
ncbi:MAG: leucine-rich repeat domain-containing protein [Muribaculum sp.]|nr:leucine-rich repeat domain-containing protein [Muribaculum sp.]